MLGWFWLLNVHHGSSFWASLVIRFSFYLCQHTVVIWTCGLGSAVVLGWRAQLNCVFLFHINTHMQDCAFFWGAVCFCMFFLQVQQVVICWVELCVLCPFGFVFSQFFSVFLFSLSPLYPFLPLPTCQLWYWSITHKWMWTTMKMNKSSRIKRKTKIRNLHKTPIAPSGKQMCWYNRAFRSCFCLWMLSDKTGLNKGNKNYILILSHI